MKGITAIGSKKWPGPSNWNERLKIRKNNYSRESEPGIFFKTIKTVFHCKSYKPFLSGSRTFKSRVFSADFLQHPETYSSCFEEFTTVYSPFYSSPKSSFH